MIHFTLFIQFFIYLIFNLFIKYSFALFMIWLHIVDSLPLDLLLVLLDEEVVKLTKINTTEQIFKNVVVTFSERKNGS